MLPLRHLALPLLLGLTSAAPAAADVAVSTSGEININSAGCGCVSTTASATQSTTEGQYDDASHNAHLSTLATASSGSLAVGTSAAYSQGTDGDWNGIYWSAVANGSLQEPVAPDWVLWNARYDQWNSTQVVFEFQVGVSGTVSASKGGMAFPAARASINYYWTVGDASGEGSKSDDVDTKTQSGSWAATNTATFTLIPGQNTYSLLFQATASSFVSKMFTPFGDAHASANADFLHTMKWLGITAMHSYDANHQEIPLPPGAYIDLIGANSGFNYWYSVDAPVAVAAGGFDRGAGASVVCAPNPVRSSTTVQFRLPDAASPISLRAFDARGRVVRTLLAGARAQGTRAVRWDGRDDAGRLLPRGVYAMRLEGPGIATATRVVLTR